MDIERTLVEGTSDKPGSETQQPLSSKAGRPPSIVLTTATNLMQLQKRIRDIVTGNFEFRSTRSGTRIVTKEMADFSAIQKHLDNNNLSYFTFFPKSEKPIKAVVRHLPSNTPAQDICDGLVDLRFDIISIKQMSASRRSTSEGSVPQNLPLFLITLPRTEKSQEIFRLTALCHTAIRVEAYRAQSGLTQCNNCQQFGHVWANCRQPPRCLWCGGGHLHKECPEKDNAASTPASSNCQLAEGEKPHPANYRGCRLAKEELQKKSQRTPKATKGRVFSSSYTTPGVSFAAARRGSTQQQQPQALQVSMSERTPTKKQSVSAPAQLHQSGQSVRAQNTSSQPLDSMLQVVTVVQQITTDQWCCVRRKAK
jgi:hypothetical protein